MAAIATVSVPSNVACLPTESPMPTAKDISDILKDMESRGGSLKIEYDYKITRVNREPSEAPARKLSWSTKDAKVKLVEKGGGFDDYVVFDGEHTRFKQVPETGATNGHGWIRNGEYPIGLMGWHPPTFTGRVIWGNKTSDLLDAGKASVRNLDNGLIEIAGYAWSKDVDGYDAGKFVITLDPERDFLPVRLLGEVVDPGTGSIRGGSLIENEVRRIRPSNQWYVASSTSKSFRIDEESGGRDWIDEHRIKVITFDTSEIPDDAFSLLWDSGMRVVDFTRSDDDSKSIIYTSGGSQDLDDALDSVVSLAKTEISNVSAEQKSDLVPGSGSTDSSNVGDVSQTTVSLGYLGKLLIFFGIAAVIGVAVKIGRRFRSRSKQ